MTTPNERCPRCDGTGFRFADPSNFYGGCPHCHGTGQAPTSEQSEAMKNYVLGFLFSPDLKRVLLIKKDPTRPDQAWQKGLRNGIGGGVEESDESPEDAMLREFREETGLTVLNWNHYARMGDEKTWMVYVFTAKSDDFDKAQTMERETVWPHTVDDILYGDYPVIENLPWLIALAVDVLTDGRPKFTIVNYP